MDCQLVIVDCQFSFVDRVYCSVIMCTNIIMRLVHLLVVARAAELVP